MKIIFLVNAWRNSDIWIFLTLNSYYQIISKKITNDISILDVEKDRNILINSLKKNYIIITFTFIISDLNILNLIKKKKLF